MNISHHRLHNQRIASTTHRTPADVVRQLGAVQAQDYLGALWAVGLRMKRAVEADVERALAERTILRTWPMRGTLHFVAAEDARWMVELMASRIMRLNVRRLKQRFDIDDAVIARSRTVLERALQGDKQLTRDAAYKQLESAKISTKGSRGLHIVWHLAHQGVLCFGARHGKQQTYALLEEWAPKAKRLKRDEALAEIARRYFTSHGPATLHDFIWWSSLTAVDSRKAIELAKEHLLSETIDGKDYWFASNLRTPPKASHAGYVLPAFDEYTVAYRDRSAVIPPEFSSLYATRNGMLNPVIVVDGLALGTWKRTLSNGSVVVTPEPFATLKKSDERAFAEAARRYGEFLGMEVEL